MKKLLGVALLAALTAAPVLAVAGPAAAAVLPPGGVVVTDTAPVFNSDSPKTAEAKCPAGKRVIGGGVRVNAGTHVVVTREEPISTPDGDSYLVTAQEDAVGTTGAWAVQATAICSDPIPGLRIVQAISSTQSGHFTFVTAECPSGTSLFGAGGRILDGQGQVGLITEVNGGQLSPHGAVAGGEEQLPGFSGNWSVIAYGVCATSNFGDVQLVTTFSHSDPTTVKIVAASCPAGMTVTGGTGWADIPGEVASVNVDAFRTRIQVIARNDTGPSGNWGAIAMALCAT
jgi:hypothetical protein